MIIYEIAISTRSVALKTLNIILKVMAEGFDAKLPNIGSIDKPAKTIIKIAGIIYTMNTTETLIPSTNISIQLLNAGSSAIPDNDVFIILNL